MYDTCIFDLYGTLVDIHTEEEKNELWEKMGMFYGYYGAYYQPEELKITFRQLIAQLEAGQRGLREDAHEAHPEIPIEQVFLKLFEEKQITADLTLAVHAGQFFRVMSTEYIRLYDGTEEMLKALKDRGIHLAVLSNKPDRQTVKVVKEIFGDNIFDYAQGQKDGIRRKPEPDGVWYLMEQMQVSKEECLYIGDSEVDAATGKNAGLKTIGVLWGFRDRKTLETAGADHLIERPEELLQFV